MRLQLINEILSSIKVSVLRQFNRLVAVMRYENN